MLLKVGSQIAIAIMGLNYGAEVDQIFALCKPGPVLIPDMKQIYPVGFNTQPRNSLGAQQYTANRFEPFLSDHILFILISSVLGTWH